MREQFELTNLRRGRREPSLHPTLHDAVATAERRNLSAYRVDELTKSGPVIRLQIGSSIWSPSTT